MIRKQLIQKKPARREKNDRIAWRSHEVTRVEALSDAVFAFAVSLLIISLEVPKSSEELINGLKGFFPFLICISLIFFIWHEQYIFFRRFGMHDTTTILLNCALIFLVLFYVYPLKFTVNWWILRNVTIRNQDFPSLMLLYNGGFFGIFGLFTLMYVHAYRMRHETNLSPAEIFQTRTFLYTHLYATCVGLLVTLVGAFGGPLSPYCMVGYGLMSGMSISSAYRDKRFHKIFGEVPLPTLHRAEEN